MRDGAARAVRSLNVCRRCRRACRRGVRRGRAQSGDSARCGLASCASAPSGRERRLAWALAPYIGGASRHCSSSRRSCCHSYDSESPRYSRTGRPRQTRPRPTPSLSGANAASSLVAAGASASASARASLRRPRRWPSLRRGPMQMPTRRRSREPELGRRRRGAMHPRVRAAGLAMGFESSASAQPVACLQPSSVVKLAARAAARAAVRAAARAG